MQQRSDERLIQAVDRAVLLLKAVADSRSPVTLAEAADAAGVNRSTAWRLLATLEHHGLIARDEGQGYVVGYAAVRIAAAADHRSLVRRARPLLERLADETGETASLSVPQHLTIVGIDQVDSLQVVSANWVGRRLPLHAASNGKLLLASLPPEELDEFLRRPLERLTPATIVEPDRLRRELDAVRAQDFGTTVEELEIGLHGVSAASRDARGHPLAFLSVSGPAFRIPRRRLAEIGERLREAASALEPGIS